MVYVPYVTVLFYGNPVDEEKPLSDIGHFNGLREEINRAVDKFYSNLRKDHL